MSNNGNSSVWSTIISVCITLFLVIKIAVKCSGSNSNSSSYQTSQHMDNLNKVLDNSRVKAADMHKIAWKNFFYMPYSKMDSTSSMIEDLYGIKKLTEDSLVRIDLKTKIKIPKESFYLNNYDDSLRFAVKFSNGTNFLMHDVESKDNIEDVFKLLKGTDLYDLKSDKKNGSPLTIFEYKLRKNPKNYNGIVAVSNSEGFMNFIEFESPKKSSGDLKIEMTDFLMNNLVENK